MIYLIATLTIKPGTLNLVVEAAKPCIAATRQEPGCIRYDLNADVTNPEQLVFVEQWKTRKDIDLHFEQPHMAVWRTGLAPHLVDRNIELIYPDNIEKL